RDDSGTQLAAAVNTTYRTDVFAKYGEQADAEIAKIIEQNEMDAQTKTAKPAEAKVAMGNQTRG
ncbi:MAG TPA: EmrA/EmrK family multidrug efflux transporter periplasmic adaptor subunit, partial [Paraburkholderia sp.]|nr:EmrA/EmrK family multidrug efflux transporter periplasmic adaptor subunit [Paraburkholderia sp.]